MSSITRVEDMPVYGSLYRLSLEVEKVTRVFTPDFKWRRNQVLRSSESVPANMTEGFYAQYSTEYLQSLYRCRREYRAKSTVSRQSQTHCRKEAPTEYTTHSSNQ